MKKFLFLILCFSILTGVFAQRLRKTKELNIIDYELQSTVKSSKYLNYIEFDKNPVGKLNIQPDSSVLISTLKPYYKNYDLSYLGHKYFFEKEFGFFPANRLLRILDSLNNESKALRYYDGRIYADYIKITESELYSDDPEEKIFIKMPELAEYPGGKIAFKKYVRIRINECSCKPIVTKDSAFFFKAILKKDSLIHDTKLYDSTQSAFTDFLQTLLRETSGWKPLNMGGRPVTKYLQVFILIRRNGDIEADYY